VSVFDPNLPDPPVSDAEREALATIRGRAFEPPMPTGQAEGWCPSCLTHRSPSPFKPCPVCEDKAKPVPRRLSPYLFGAP